MSSGIVLEGLQEFLQKSNPQLLAQPLRQFLQRSVITVQGKARENAPVDTGRLRSSIATEIDSSTPPHWGQIGTNVSYAKPMEYGTGRLSDAPDSQGGVHWPPGDALQTWASRHGFKSGYQVARIIGKRGGLKPRKYLRKALSDSLSAIQGFVNQLGDDLKAAWGK